METIRVWFTKVSRVKYISHLDLVRCMDRALRRSKLPVWYTEGFNPHIYITFANPLSLGHESICEIMEFRLLEHMDCNEVCKKLNAVLPDGLKALKAQYPTRPLTDIGGAVYDISLNISNNTAEQLKAFLNSEQILTAKKSKKGVKTVDIRPMIFDFSLNHGEDCWHLHLKLAAGQTSNLNPSLIIAAFEDHGGDKIEVLRYFRTGLLDKEKNIFE